MTLLLALDQGMSSSRSIVFDAEGRIVATAQRELRQIYPRGTTLFCSSRRTSWGYRLCGLPGRNRRLWERHFWRV